MKLQIGKYRVVNGLWNDGAIWIGDMDTQRIIASWGPPIWFVNLYNRLRWIVKGDR